MSQAQQLTTFQDPFSQLEALPHIKASSGTLTALEFLVAC